MQLRFDLTLSPTEFWGSAVVDVNLKTPKFLIDASSLDRRRR